MQFLFSFMVFGILCFLTLGNQSRYEASKSHTHNIQAEEAEEVQLQEQEEYISEQDMFPDYDPQKVEQDEEQSPPVNPQNQNAN